MTDIFYFTDIHGHLPLYNAIMDFCGKSLIIFGGDAIDRGEDGYTIMKDLLKRPNVIYLKGNHEDMFVAAVKEFKQHFSNPQLTDQRLESIFHGAMVFDTRYPELQLAAYNGGKSTIKAWYNDGMPMDIVEKIDKLPLGFSINNFDFCHAGGVYPSFSRKNKTQYDIDDLLWNRSAFDYGWAPKRYCIHGHTPTVIMPKKFIGSMTEKDIAPIKYRGNFDDKYTGYKINMDTGAFATNRAFVLNCSTLSTTGFQYKDNKIEKLETVSL